jgi:hypothetical protein
MPAFSSYQSSKSGENDMSVPAEKPLVDMTNKELITLLRIIAAKNKFLNYHYNDVRFELERRRVERWTKLSFLLSIAAITVSVVGLATSIAALLSRR